MKKRLKNGRKFLLLMKFGCFPVLIVLLFMDLVQAGRVAGQEVLDQRVTIEVNQTEVRAVLKQIEKQTRARFIYSQQVVPARRKVSLRVEGQSLSRTLDLLLSPLSIIYDVSGKHIVLDKARQGGYNETQAIPDFPEHKVEGRVTDEKGEALPGVNILVKGTQRGLITDSNGQFSMEVPDERTVLVFSFVGYLNEEVTVGKRTHLEISLREDEKALEEVVVVGYGEIKKENLTNAVSIMNSSAIDKRPIPTLDEALVGQISGVRVQQSSGMPGEDLNITIRGISSINGSSNPLYVIDGVIRNDMRDLNPSDIATIQILKDASASAIYGAQGGNGVVLIETKQGGGKPKLTFDTFYGIQRPTKLLGLMNADEWRAYNIWNRNVRYLDQGGSMQDPMEARPQGLRIPSEWFDYEGTDWLKELVAPAPMQSYQLSGSAQSDMGSFFISGGYMQQQGMVPNTNYSRINFRLNGTLNFGRKIEFGMSMAPSFGDRNGSTQEGKDQGGLQSAIAMSPLVPINMGTLELGIPAGIGDVALNPIERAKKLTDNTRTANFLSSVWGEYKILKVLKFKTLFGYDYRQNNYEYFLPASVSSLNANAARAQGRANTNNNTLWSWQNFLTYDHVLQNHHLNIVVGQSMQRSNTFSASLRADGWASDQITTLNVAATPTLASTTSSAYANASLFGRVSYVFNDKYLINGSLRYDGSSRFGSDNKWGLFPAISAGWKINKETFMEGIPWLSLLKIRASWGRAGNDQIGNYEYLSLLSVDYYSLNGTKVFGTAPGNIENPNLKWESKQTFDLGLDAGILGGKIQFNFDYYLNRSIDLLFETPIPQSTGFSNYLNNLGTVENSGWEFDLTSQNVVNNLFRWTTSINLTANRNKIIDMGGVNQFIIAPNFSNFLFKVGSPIAQFYAYRTDGLLNADDFDNDGNAKVAIFPGQIEGNIKYIDQNNDGIINSADLAPAGHNYPDLIYGITNRFSWKGLELSILMQGQIGGTIMWAAQRSYDRGYAGRGQYARWIRAWKPDYETLYGEGENPIPDLGIDMSWDGHTPNPFGRIKELDDDQSLYNTSYFRIRNINLSYDIPTKVISKALLKSARVYFSVDNAFTFTNYIGGNPESNSFGNDLERGVDWNGVPLPKKYVLGVSVSF